MSWVAWRQYRAQAVIAAALLAAFAAAILVDGFQIAAHWHAILATCAGDSACLHQEPAPTLANGVVSDLPYLSLAVPVVLGMLWGAPLVAHELETRTSDFAWAPSVTRTRWLAVKAGLLLLAALVRGGAQSGRRQQDRAVLVGGLGFAGQRAACLLPATARRPAVKERLAVRHVLVHASERLARVDHLSARRPLLAVPGHRDRDLRPAGGGADRGRGRHRSQAGRIACYGCAGK